MPKAYIIAEVSYEYNDEIYHTGNDGASYSSPDEIFLDKTKAHEKRDKLERNHWRGLEVSQYAYSTGELTDLEDDELKTRLTEILRKGSKATKRRQELQKKLSKALTGKALEKALDAAVEEEFAGEDGVEVDIECFTVPEDATDEQIDEIRKVFNQLAFYEVLEAPLNVEV